ncbi:pyruvate ferredoxin oxidoreductase [Candidatus Woesearchaeota archaeon]|nr:pyruvate ferredoxin oxidoreductase [Candidatus Woesearchaeota archaeon]
MANIRELALDGERLASGHRLCPGCALPIIARAVMRGTKDPIVVSNATGCLEVSTTIYPYTAWKVPWIHNAFENAAATITGVEAAYKALKRTGKINKEIKFLAFGGDGGTYDIGLQSLSGALERGHDFVYVCVDNEGYMNTGIQRSSSTPYGAWTNTSAVGKAHKGKEQFKKELTAVVAAHHIPYVAQASPHNYMDLLRKSEKAFAAKGPAFINVLSPCVPGWKYPSSQSIKLAKLAVDTCFWPLFEIENDTWILNYDPGINKKPIIEWLKLQGRFRHLMKPENAHIVEQIQNNIDLRWEQLKKWCGKA